MKLATSDRGATTVNGPVKRIGFSIASNAKAFEILSSGLYSDKITAVIRELGTNGADSHIQAGKAHIPFHVHLPTQMEPWFSITDQGISLTEEQAETLYTTYFESDKTETNEQDGCLGLGSKSPLAYTDLFIADVRKDGIRRIYNVCLDEHGEPQLLLISEQETNEPDGVTVKLAVKPEDFNEFRLKAARVYRWFQVRPIVNGEPLDYKDDSWLFEGKDYKILEKDYDGASATSYVVMGNVAYPINTGDFSGDKSLGDVAEMLIKYGIVLWVDRGDVDISASREKLQYSRHTVAFLRKKFESIADAIYDEIVSQISGQPTLWDARLFVTNKMRGTILGRVATKAKKGLEYKGSKLYSGSVPLVKFGKPRKDGQGNVFKDDERDPVTMASVTECSLSYGRKDKLKFTHDFVKTLPVSGDDCIIYATDTEDTHGKFVRIEMQMRDRGLDRLYLIRPTETFDLDKFLAIAGLEDIIEDVSKYPQPSKENGGITVRQKTAKVLLWKGCQTWTSKQAHAWGNHEVDLDEGGVYVEVHRYKVNAGTLTVNRFCEPSTFASVLEKYTESIKASVPTIIGFRGTMARKVEKLEQWVCLDEYLKDRVLEYLPLHDSASLYGGIQEFRNGYQTNKVVPELDNLVKMDMSNLAINHPLRALATRWNYFNELREDSTIQRAHKVFANFCDRYDEVPAISDRKDEVMEVAGDWEDLKEHYPMLALIDWSYRRVNDLSEFHQPILSYIDMIDALLGVTVMVA
jgi:hypothetical protein